MTSGTHFNVEQFMKALPGSGGLITVIAKRVGCEWHTAEKWIRKHPTLQAAYQAERSAIDDTAEAAIIKAIQAGDIDSAWKWVRARRRKEFGDSVDVTSGGEKLKGYIGWTPEEWGDEKKE